MSSVKTLFKRGLLALCSSVCLLSTTLGNDQPLIAALAALENQYNVYFSYNPEELTDVQVDFATDRTENIDQAINRLLRPTVFQYESFGEKFYVIYNKSKAGKKDLRKLRRHWNGISKLEKKGNLSLNRSQPNTISSITDEISRLKGAKWNEGKVVDATTKEGLIGANIIIENTNAGTATDAYGNFSFHASTRPPYQLRISYTGYRDKIINVTTTNQYKLNVQLSSEGVLLNQIVVGASRHSERFVEAPVTVEKLDINALPTSSAEGVIESLANLKGVQVVKGSIAGAVINTRGFANMNNLRFLMHLDGMDVTSPAFGVYSNMGGVSALDLQSVEIIPGASSALYGANAFNGILLMQSKDPFVHQGLSTQLKTGITQHSISGNSPYNNFSIRYAKTFNNKFAYKIDYEGLFTKDWIAHDLSERNLDINPEILADRQPPLVDANQAGYDAVNIHGDKDTEAFTKVLETGEIAQTSSGESLLWKLDNVHRTGYTEQELFDPSVSNHRLNVGLHYRLSKDWRMEYLYKYAVQDLILRHTTNYPFYDFTLQHHKIELKGKGLTARWYHNHEYAKNTWSGSYLAASIQNQLLDNTAWKQRFVDAYAGEIANLPSANIGAARVYADQGMAAVGAPEWLTARQASVASPTVFNPDGVIGAKLAENSAFWQADLVYDFNNQLPKDSWKILVGANFRRYIVDSDGAFFNDNRLLPNSLAGAHLGYKDNIYLAESGLFGQVANNFFDNRLQFSFVGRFNHHTNFRLNFTPQVAAVFTPDADKKHHLRTSFTTGVRNPGIQEQYINFLISPNHVILGGAMNNLDNYYDPFLDLTGAQLKTVFKEQLGYDHQGLRPERNSTLEVGYKSLLAKGKLLVDVSAYGSQYLNFVERANLTIQGADGQSKIHALYANLSDKVNAYGIGLNVEYVFQKYCKLYANFQHNDFQILSNDTGFGYVSPAFNTPKNRVNWGISRQNKDQRFGFDVAARYVSDYDFISTLGKGYIPAFLTADAAISYRVGRYNFTLSATNILGQEYRTIYGGPAIGSIYSLSILYKGE